LRVVVVVVVFLLPDGIVEVPVVVGRSRVRRLADATLNLFSSAPAAIVRSRKRDEKITMETFVLGHSG
jgi:alpha-galactosidase/6-phospho-beta-glucosidase family protein